MSRLTVTAALATAALIAAAPLTAATSVTASQPNGRQPIYLTAAHASGDTVRWNPCQDHTWAVRGSSHTAIRKRISNAFAYVSSVTGITFNETRDYAAADVKATLNVSRRFDTTPSHGGFRNETRWRDGDTVHPARIISGNIQWNLNPRWGRNITKTIIVHEIGHVLNMGHSPLRTQVMYPFAHPGSPTKFQKWDLVTLKTLDSSNGCITSYTANPDE